METLPINVWKDITGFISGRTISILRLVSKKIELNLSKTGLVRTIKEDRKTYDVDYRGRKHGTYIFLSNSVSTFTQKYNYIHGKRSGIQTELDLDGNLISVYNYRDDEKDGLCIDYYNPHYYDCTTTSKLIECTYRMGKYHGDYFKYDKHGRVTVYTFYQNGKPYGDSVVLNGGRIISITKRDGFNQISYFNTYHDDHGFTDESGVWIHRTFGSKKIREHHSYPRQINIFRELTYDKNSQGLLKDIKFLNGGRYIKSYQTGRFCSEYFQQTQISLAVRWINKHGIDYYYNGNTKTVLHSRSDGTKIVYYYTWYGFLEKIISLFGNKEDVQTFDLRFIDSYVNQFLTKIDMFRCEDGSVILSSFDQFNLRHGYNLALDLKYSGD